MGRFYPMAGDVAFMVPIIEMAGEHHHFVSDIMYIYNDENIINEHRRNRQLQLHLARSIIYKHRYKPLQRKPGQKNYSALSEVIVFAESPEKLQQLLDSLYAYVTGVNRIFVVYGHKSLQEKNDYHALQTLYPTIGFYSIDEQKSNVILFFIYLQIQSNYVLFVKGDTVFQKPLCLSECINALEDTNAYAFYFRLAAQEGMRLHHNAPLLAYKNDMYAWNFAAAVGSDQWSSVNSVDCVLHKKENTHVFALQSTHAPTPDWIEDVWANEANLDQVGLCFGESYVTTLL